MFLKKIFIVAFGLALTLPGIASAAVVRLGTDQSTFDANVLNQGWWASAANSVDSNTNHLTGGYGGEYRSFYTFDLRGINGKIKNATLNVVRGDQTANVVLGLWEVVSSAESVNNNTGVNAAIFSDLGSGTSYGSFSVANGNSDDRLDFALNAQGLKDLNRTDGYFTIGASLPNKTGYIFGATGADVTYLTLELAPSDVPEPASIALFGLALAGLALHRRRNA